MEKADILEMAVKHLKALRETVNSKSDRSFHTNGQFACETNFQSRQDEQKLLLQLKRAS